MSAKNHKPKSSHMSLLHASKLFSLYFVIVAAVLAFIDFGADRLFSPYLIALSSVIIAGITTAIQYFNKIKNSADDFVEGNEFK